MSELTQAHDRQKKGVKFLQSLIFSLFEYDVDSTEI